MKFLVTTKGDSSVGIGGDRAEVETDVELFGSPHERSEYIASIKAALVNAFSQVFDGKVEVLSDEDLKAIDKAYGAIEPPATVTTKNPVVENIRSAFFGFLCDSDVDNDGDPESGNHWYARAKHGLQFGALAKALGYPNEQEAMYASGQWEPPAPIEQ